MRNSGLASIVAIGGLIVFSASAEAQHATASDISDGERAFADNCANCHGPDGNLIAGIDLGRGMFRREYADAELVGIIMNGIPNTPMPATPRMTEAQAERIVAYLRSRATDATTPALVGDADRGRSLFFGRGDCLDCHAIRGVGSRHGPDLSNIGRERRAVEIEASLIDPAARVDPAGRSYRVVTADGAEVVGRLLNHDTFTVQMIDSDERLRSFVKDDLNEHGFAATSMPAYGDSMSTQEIADLVSFLVSMQGASE